MPMVVHVMNPFMNIVCLFPSIRSKVNDMEVIHPGPQSSYSFGCVNPKQLWSRAQLSKPSLFRATSHTRLRARDHYTSSTLIGGKGGAGPTSLHTTLEWLTTHVNARWTSSLHGFLHGIKWIMFHGCLNYFQKSFLGGRPTTKPRDHGTPNAYLQPLVYFISSWTRTRMKKNMLK